MRGGRGEVDGKGAHGHELMNKNEVKVIRHSLSFYDTLCFLTI